MADKNQAIYLIELFNAEVDGNGDFIGVDVMPQFFCQTKDEARQACETLTKSLSQCFTYTVKGESLIYPLYNYQEIPRFNQLSKQDIS